ncbi:DUF3696 domain-containing protein [Hymenobacter weizhouensis]|uniref:DUF3696 domain-containing protein n=1 Tax=Hymenobacter sp. YIM 151500-1 TaxID=2987689 RepID=UPI002225F615|nr:DUF3696 domain-containing protein [Hymenobacter sp. YIM 151500-1]UYZ64721.1 DUF3696 domain-containing protein [Hymenobacter sp. YIM 151500-1]
MLNSLRIQNFKSWKDTGDIQFGSITGFFGTNSSGKTSILQFLLMLKQTVESSDRAQILNLGDERSYAELGTMHDIIHNHESHDYIEFKITYNSSYPVLLPAETELDGVHIGDIEFKAIIEKSDDETSLIQFQYLLDNKSFGISQDQSTNEFYVDIHGIEMEENEHIFPNINDPYKFYGFPNILSFYYNKGNVFNDLPSSLQMLFDKFYYLGPLRDYPKRLYTWAGEKTQGVGNRGERAIAALLASRNHPRLSWISMGTGKVRRSLEEHIAYWLKELGLIHSFAVRPIAPNRKEYEVRIKRTAESAEVFLTDVGFGVSQLLPVLVLLFYVPEGSTIILEQPEIHLHPAVQAGLADVFIDAIKRRNVQIILESHSEHLLQRLQLRMAEKGLNPEKEFDSTKANLYFTSIEQGESKLTPLQLDEYGNINNWPDGFFGDTLGEAAAMMKAEMKRKMHQ